MLKLYWYSKCDTCRRAKKWLEAKGKKFEEIDITLDPPSLSELKGYLKKSGKELKDFLNRSGVQYREQNMKEKVKSLTPEKILEMLSKEGKKMSEILRPLEEKYFISGEINSTVADPDAKVAEIEARYGDGEITKLDGISIDYDDWHFNVRPSKTEPLLRLNLEAYTAADMERRRDEVLSVIRG